MNTRVAVIVSLVLTGAAGAYFGWVYPSLPAQMPSHWNINGEVDGWTSKATMAWVMPLLMLGLTAFMGAAQWLSPRGWDVQPFRPTFNLIVVIITAMLGYIWVVSAVIAVRPDAEGSRLIVGGLLVFLAAMGNFMGKVRKNFWMGLRLPWTLASDRVWVASHRLLARLLTAAGVIGAVVVLAGGPMWLALGGILAAVLIPCVYSFVLYKRLNPPAAGAAAMVFLVGAFAVGAPARVAEAQPVATEVTFAGAGGLELKGTLLMPEAVGAWGAEVGQRVPAALLLPGSGPPDRDGNVRPMMVTDVLKQIAERLAEEGIATLRFDKRSVAGTYAAEFPKDAAGLSEFFAWENFVGDAKGAVEFLRGREGVDGERVAIFGHSEGGLITLQIAHDTAGTEGAPAAIVLAGTAGRRLDHVVRNQVSDLLDRQGATGEVKQMFMGHTDRAIEQVREEGTVPRDMPAGLAPLFNPTVEKLLAAYFTLEPAELAAAYGGPVLIVQGEKDVQVLAEKDLPLLRAAFEGREDGEVEVVIVRGASHNFKSVEKESDAGFEGPVVGEVLEKVAGWLGEKLKGGE